MEMDTEFLFQIGAVIASLSGAWALVRSQVTTLKANQAEIKNYVETENPTEFKRGEWVSERDSLKGISIRKGKLAFFENLKFTADSIYDYKVVGSVSIVGTQKNNIGTFIKRMNLSDTLYSEIIEFTYNTLRLKKDNKIELVLIKKDK